MARRGVIRLVGVALWFAAAGPVVFGQQISYTVAFDDPDQTSADLYQSITQHVQAAGARWNAYLRPTTNTVLEVQVGFLDNMSSQDGSGRSLVSERVGTFGGRRLLEQGAAYEIRTGVDPNGTGADIELKFKPSYLRNTLWFDPNPNQRAATVPADKTDAMSVFLHELGHVFAFNGWRNGVTGDLPGDYLSTFDQHVTLNNEILYFEGPLATRQYGNRPVPLTFDNAFHLGNKAPRPGTDLLSDLMNGVEFTNGTRYDISLLDVAILADSGVPVVPVPEPVLGLGVAVVGLALFALRRSRDRQGAVNPPSRSLAVAAPTD